MLGLFGKSNRYLISIVLAVVFSIVNTSLAAAQTMLTLENPANGVVIALTEDDLLAFTQVLVKTENEFVDGMGEFSGPLVRDILTLMGDAFETANFMAVNEYSIEIPAADFEKYDVIFAMSLNGEKFSLRDKGPIWLIYPMSDHKELQDRVYNNRLIWQLTRVTAQ